MCCQANALHNLIFFYIVKICNCLNFIHEIKFLYILQLLAMMLLSRTLTTTIEIMKQNYAEFSLAIDSTIAKQSRQNLNGQFLQKNLINFIVPRQLGRTQAVMKKLKKTEEKTKIISLLHSSQFQIQFTHTHSLTK